MGIRVALVGCGAIARRSHLAGLRRAGADVVCFTSRSLASAEAACGEWGSGDVVASWEAVVNRDDVEAVDVCTPNRLHAPITIAAANAGKHVLVEKPIACTVEEADAMIAAADSAGTVLMPAHNIRFAKPFWAARRAVEDKLIGDIVGFRTAFGHGGPQRWSPDASWFFDPELSGGGALIDLGIHTADAIRSITHDDAVTVAAGATAAPGENERAGHVIITMGNGAIGSLHASWEARPAPDHQLTFFGTEGTLHLDSATPLTLKPAGGEARPVDYPETAPDLFSQFVAAASNGTPPLVTGADGRNALAIICGAYESIRSGSTVTIVRKDDA